MNSATLTAVVVGFMVFFTLGTAFIAVSDTTESNDLDINIIAKANINGSGIFADRPLSIDPKSPSEINAWGGLVFMTPGPGSIQHYMLGKFVVEDLGLKYAMYSTGSLSSDTVYWTPVAPVNMRLVYLSGDNVSNGGFPWEPYYSDIILTVDDVYAVASSEEIEENHPCCMVAAKTSFLESNEAAVLRFLSAYMEALDWVNNALASKDSENPGDYLNLLFLTSEFSKVSPTTLEDAFGTLTYMYDLVDSSGADSLEHYTSNLIESFESLGIITKKVDDPTAFANKFINHTYLNKILKDGKTEVYPEKKVKIRVGHLGGDIHQIGFVIGMKLGIFDKYGVEIISTLYPNGPGVMQAFQLGIIDIGILGLPPAVSNTANFR
ncbi:MAG: ABC transporter substrate-binding protein [Methanomassiliicoccaceae archaeon]|nr:ABC transporter substrate-binding protein [Methanomassiliicoccaceae archaeon]